eukprot:Skav236749  [mRNA]  locus=scaffold2899:132158:133714:- [translate_table: standard]
MAKRVVITGCTRGIGRALFEHFATEHEVAGCGRSTADLEALKLKQPKAKLKQLDLSSSSELQRWCEELKADWGQIDLLVANAGMMPPPAKFWEIPAQDWQTALEVNVLNTSQVLRHSVPLLKEGSIVVLVSSRYGRSVSSGMACYSATKWATEAMAKTLALELQQQKVVVVSLDPGVVNTQMLRQSCQEPGELDWCHQQRSQEDFAAETGPFLLSLTMEDTGRNLTAPGSPPSYFQTAVAYKDRPAWANGFSSFQAGSHNTTESKNHSFQDGLDVTEGGRRYFISGVMLGSKQKLEKAEADLVPQVYRKQIAEVIRKEDPHAVIVDPLDAVKSRAQRMGQTFDDINLSDEAVRDAFTEVVESVKGCDVIVSHLPEASMGSAVELWEARKANLQIFTISPMKDNWTIRSVTDHNFVDLADFTRNLGKYLGAQRTAEDLDVFVREEPIKQQAALAPHHGERDKKRLPRSCEAVVQALNGFK